MSIKLENLRIEISNVINQRYKLLFLIPESTTQQKLINDLNHEGIPTVNIGLYLSEQLRLIPSDKRPYDVAKWLRQAINEQKNDVVCIHSIEYLFDTELKQNPVKLLEANSGNTVLLVVWPGKGEQGVLYYATPEHQEYTQNSEYSNSIIFY
ncbi:BREX-3 system P-loop-containing protein BrxF [Paenibacillus sp. WC2504]|uniref:BREX-3 system P-loop-containing protein BrxF n=1 Tax=Paenibacillus sp. WC2504 TaxID=3461403 RepID=UPI004045994A